MSRCRSNVPRLGPLDPVFVRYPGSDTAASSIKYIVCLNGRVPERYEVWSLNAHGVRKVHPTARVKLFDAFAEDNFQSTFFNSRRFRIPFIGRRSVNGSIEFIRFTDVMLLGLDLQIPSLSNILVAMPPLLRSSTLSVWMAGSLKDTRSGVLMRTEFARFIRLLHRCTSDLEVHLWYQDIGQRRDLEVQA